jgi:hypothetical protein
MKINYESPCLQKKKHKKNKILFIHVEFEVPKAVIVKWFILWVIIPCSLLKAIKHDNHVTLLETIYSCANTTHVLIFTTCFGRDAPSSGEAEYNTSNYKSLLNCNINYNKT